MKKRICICLLAIVSLTLNAQEIVIKGSVKDAGNSEPVVAANVSLLTTDSALVGGVATDNKGNITTIPVCVMAKGWMWYWIISP